MKSLRRIFKRLRCMKSNRCKKLHGDWRNSIRISYHVICFSVELVYVNCFEGFKFNNLSTIFHILPLSLLFPIINCSIFVSLFQSFDLKQYDTFHSFCILFLHMFLQIDLYILCLVLIEQRRHEDDHGLVFSFLSLVVANLRVACLFTTLVKKLMNCSN